MPVIQGIRSDSGGGPRDSDSLFRRGMAPGGFGLGSEPLEVLSVGSRPGRVTWYRLQEHAQEAKTAL